MTKHRDLAYGDRLPESLLDALAEYVSTGIFNFHLTLASATSVQVVAGTGNGQVGVAVNGRWRYNSTTVNAAHPAGAAGQYDVFVTASDNVFVLGPPEVDNTVYTFGLVILAQGNTPGTALSRKVAETTWNGSAITALSLTGGSYASASPTVVQAVPAGVISQYAGATAPAGYLLCNGALVSRTTYAALFAAIGTTYGVGDGSTTFGLPDCRGRAAVGYDASQTEFNALGKTGGVKTHPLVLAEIPGHSHTVNSHSHTVNSHSHGGTTGAQSANHQHATGGVSGNLGVSAMSRFDEYPGVNVSTGYQIDALGDHTHGTFSENASHVHVVNAEAPGTNAQTPGTTSVGGDGAHQNLQPYLALNSIIKT